VPCNIRKYLNDILSVSGALSILFINPYMTLIEWLPSGEGEAGQLAYGNRSYGWNEDFNTGFPASQISSGSSKSGCLPSRELHTCQSHLL